MNETEQRVASHTLTMKAVTCKNDILAVLRRLDDLAPSPENKRKRQRVADMARLTKRLERA